MPQHFDDGDILIFQLEAGFGLMRVIGTDADSDDVVWHVSVYNELFPDIDTAEATINSDSKLTINFPHLALTNRAFESTQVAKIANQVITATETEIVDEWRNSEDPEISDRSVRLHMGFR